MLKANYHTHTVFCDGDNTAQEMVDRARQNRPGRSVATPVGLAYLSSPGRDGAEGVSVRRTFWQFNIRGS